MSDLERKMRHERKFHDIESNLPNIRADPASDNRPTLTNDLLSHLGHWNPFPQQITANDTVWLLDNTAYRSPETNEWQAEFVAAVFDQNSGVEISTVVADVAGKLGIGKGDAAEATIQERLMPFVQSVLPGRVVNAEFAQKEVLKLGPGGRNGISSDIKSIPGSDSGSVVSTVARVPQGANGILEGKTFFAEPEGWGLISGEDIDDTIKVTQTSDPIGILRSTFVSEATPVQASSQKTSPFFYLSASPYNLYYFLSQFRQQFYPQGTMILRDASWMNLSGLLSNLTLGTQEYKVDRMVKINSWVPRRKMICIGDSTQSDPEAYGEIFHKFPGWVHLILIRKVTDIAAIGLEEKNEPKRFEKAFDGVPDSVWHVFESAEECYKIISDVVGNNSQVGV
ncbi:hypothetical protein LSUB1_G004493 [Lachnellula subtilissima]|uniref:Phosphatidate phosphatase APP1 catalytic domain-containing protein n=1 Tax=Lachnellula subtilissima TaxID=602034 RepID=A0A8H8RQ06_9HELO|nr:hypothetical protein LSUB1_G004493 [Lachnellula subtilissima]